MGVNKRYDNGTREEGTGTSVSLRRALETQTIPEDALKISLRRQRDSLNAGHFSRPRVLSGKRRLVSNAPRPSKVSRLTEMLVVFAL